MTNNELKTKDWIEVEYSCGHKGKVLVSVMEDGSIAEALIDAQMELCSDCEKKVSDEWYMTDNGYSLVLR